MKGYTNMNKVQELYIENIVRESLRLGNRNRYWEYAIPCSSEINNSMNSIQTFAHCLEMEDILISKIESGKVKTKASRWTQSYIAENNEITSYLFSDVDVIAELEDRLTQIVVVEGAREAFKVNCTNSDTNPRFTLEFVEGTDTPVEKIYEELEFIHNHFCSAKLMIELDYANKENIEVTIADFLSLIMHEIKEKKKAGKAK